MYHMKSCDQLSIMSDSVDSNFSQISQLSDDDSCCPDSSFAFSADSTETSTSCLRINQLQNDNYRKLAFCDTSALSEDLRLITDMPDLCDVMFIVGKDHIPVYGVKAIMATRSRHFYQMILSEEKQQNLAQKNPERRFKSLLRKLRKMKGKKRSSDETRNMAPGVLTICIEDADPGTFCDVIRFLHTGQISICLDNVIGVMVTAHKYGLTDLCTTCFHFATRFINLDTILQLLTSTLTFSDNKWTKRLLVKIWDFITENAQLIILSPRFEVTAKCVSVMILSAPKLTTTTEDVQKAMSRWSRRHAHVTKEGSFDSVMEEMAASVKSKKGQHESQINKYETAAVTNEQSIYSLQSTNSGGSQESLSRDSGIVSSAEDV